jgi:hypothetical protein
MLHKPTDKSLKEDRKTKNLSIQKRKNTRQFLAILIVIFITPQHISQVLNRMFFTLKLHSSHHSSHQCTSTSQHHQQQQHPNTHPPTHPLPCLIIFHQPATPASFHSACKLQSRPKAGAQLGGRAHAANFTKALFGNSPSCRECPNKTVLLQHQVPHVKHTYWPKADTPEPEQKHTLLKLHQPAPCRPQPLSQLWGRAEVDFQQPS